VKNKIDNLAILAHDEDPSWVIDELFKKRGDIKSIVVTVEFKDDSLCATIASKMDVKTRLLLKHVVEKTTGFWLERMDF